MPGKPGPGRVHSMAQIWPSRLRQGCKQGGAVHAAPPVFFASRGRPGRRRAGVEVTSSTLGSGCPPTKRAAASGATPASRSKQRMRSSKTGRATTRSPPIFRVWIVRPPRVNFPSGSSQFSMVFLGRQTAAASSASGAKNSDCSSIAHPNSLDAQRGKHGKSRAAQDLRRRLSSEWNVSQMPARSVHSTASGRDRKEAGGKCQSGDHAPPGKGRRARGD